MNAITAGFLGFIFGLLTAAAMFSNEQINGEPVGVVVLTGVTVVGLALCVWLVYKAFTDTPGGHP